MTARAAVVIVLLFWGLGGCGFTGDPTAGQENVLRMNNMAEPAHLDPAMQTVVEDQRITLALFEGLCAYDPRTLAPVPGAATGWDVSADGRRYVFHLRETHWSDGVPVRASDFARSWKRVLTPPTDDERRREGIPHLIVSPYADLLYVIEGARKYHEGASIDFDDVGIRVVDERTLEVRLEQSVPWFLELTAFATFMPVPPHVLERHGRDWTRPENLVSNGPFRMKDRRVGDMIHIERNPRYWDASNVHLDGIVYFSADHIDTALDQYLAGESDWVRRFNPLKVRAWRNDAKLSSALRAPEYIGTYFYRFNVRRKPLNDSRVRKALAMATDRAAICTYITGLGEEPAEGIVPSCVHTKEPWSRVEGSGLGFDPDRARAELASAGFPGGRGFPELTLAFNTDVKNKAIAEAVQAMWREHLGITLRLENREKRVHLAEERAGNYEISRGSWVGDYNDPTTFLDFMTSTRSNNRTGWKSAEFDRLVESSLAVRDEAARLRMLEKAERILMVEEAPLLGIYYFRSEQVVRPGKFEGIFDNSRDVHPPKSIRIIS